MEKRKELIQEIFNGFLKDLVQGYSLLTNVEDKIYFLDTIYDLIKEVLTDYENEFDIPHFVNQKLLSRFRAKMLPFTSSFMEFYFSQAEECQRIIFKKLAIAKDTPFLSLEEFEGMLEKFAAAIRLVQKSVYLEEQPEPLILELVTTQPIKKEEREIKMPGFNRNRQALMLHYLLNSEGITRNQVFITDMARFAHYLLAWDYTNIGNTDLYKRLKDPFDKDNKLLLSDLEFVLTQFESIKHKVAVELIRKKIASIPKQD